LFAGVRASTSTFLAAAVHGRLSGWAPERRLRFAVAAASANVLVPGDVEVTVTRDYGDTAREKSNELLKHLLLATVSVTALIALLDWDRPRQGLMAFGRYLGLTFALLLPFLVFVQVSVGLPAYVRGGLPHAQTSTRLRFNALPIRIDKTAPFASVGPPGGPRVHVRWVASLDEATRLRKERAYGLAWPEPLGGPTWSYVPEDRRRENLEGLVGDPDVEDTHNIDRAAFQVTFHESWWEWFDRRVPVLRIRRVLPGVLTRANALAWFYDVTFAIATRGSTPTSGSTGSSATSCIGCGSKRAVWAMPNGSS